MFVKLQRENSCNSEIKPAMAKSGHRQQNDQSLASKPVRLTAFTQQVKAVWGLLIGVRRFAIGRSRLFGFRLFSGIGFGRRFDIQQFNFED